MPEEHPQTSLPWIQEPVWRVLDTAFGQHFLHTWHAWLHDAGPHQRLHYVGLLARVPTDFSLRPGADLSYDPLAPLAQELAGHLWGLLPGFHRIELSRGRVSLTLCIGPLQTLLQAQDFLADEVRLGDSSTDMPSWDCWSAKALARLCRRGTRLTHTGLPPEQQAVLAQAGFDFATASYAPHWELRRTRQPTRVWLGVPGRCAVIGAGLAGASTAAALARRGWQVDVYDAAPAPAAGASGLPVGLLLPHVSADDSPRSRLSRAGVRMTLQQAHALLKDGQDWRASGVLEHRIDKSAGLTPHLSDKALQGKEWSRRTQIPVDAPWAKGMEPEAPTLWHAHAGWIKPAALVQAWLREPGVRFIGQVSVGAIQHDEAGWTLRDADRGSCLGQAQLLVLANAGGATPLLAQWHAQQLIDHAPFPPLQGLRGVMSWGEQTGMSDLWPPCPVNGQGALISSVPHGRDDASEGCHALRWYAGATYEAVEQPTPDAAHHARNFEKLHTLLPACANALQPAFATGLVQAWQGVRWTTADRMPWVGPLVQGNNPSLWICAGMGSRGLSLTVLCAELLAAQIAGEPLPVERELAARLDVTRHLGPN